MGSLGGGQWIVLLVLGLLGYAMLKGMSGRDANAKMSCTSCGVTGPTKTRTPGSILIEIVLWLCFIIPGLIYSLWRHSARKQVCGACGAATLIPPGSPVAASLAGSAPPASMATELAKLGELRDRGLLTAAEFETQKAKLLR